MKKCTHSNKELLSVKNSNYRKCLIDLFEFLYKYDLGEKDLTVEVCIENPKEIVSADFLAKTNGIICGIEEIAYLCSFKKIKFTSFKKDGEPVLRGEKIARIECSKAKLLSLERVLLNIMQRMSGIATFVNNLIKEVKAKNLNVKLCATRKVFWPLLDKKAVEIGGGFAHRLSLDQAVLIKDNHFKFQKGGIKKTMEIVKKNKSLLEKSSFIEAEAENGKEALMLANELINYKNPILLLDNFSLKEAKKIIENLRKNFPALKLEISGGINPKNLLKYASLNPDFISLSYLTTSAQPLDISLDYQPRK